MKTKGTLILLVMAVLALLASLGLYVRVGATADAVTVLKTSGMTCGSCASAISEALQKTKGVASTEVDVEGGWVLVGYNSQAVTPEQLAGKVRTAGYASSVQQTMTPEQFYQKTGRSVGGTRAASGCCGKGGCRSGGSRS